MFLAKLWVSSDGPKYCQPIKFQGFLKCNISRKKRIINFILAMQINIFYKEILSFWLCIIRHAQSIQYMFTYLCSIPRKAWAIKLIFYLQINKNIFYKLIASILCIAGHPQSTQSKNFIISLQYFKESVKVQFDFCLLIIVFFQTDTIILDVFDQTCPNYPK